MLMNLDHIYIDVYMSRFINININVGNARMNYIVKRREYLANDLYIYAVPCMPFPP
jgi:hypothetical protein